MKVAIVGTSHDMTDNEERDVRQLIPAILKDFVPIETTIITGGAKGVDSIAGEIALSNGFAYKPIFPLGFGWKFNKIRNEEIAKECDQLFCITIPTHDKKCYHHEKEQDHQKTAGCYTLKLAEKLGKECRLLVTPAR